MDDDIYVFELFQQVFRSLEDDTPTSQTCVLSKNPKYAADDPAKQITDRKERL